jgi:DNA polymerase III delta subunit
MSAAGKGAEKADKGRDLAALFKADGVAVAAFVGDEELKKDELLKQVLAAAGKDASVIAFAPGETGDKPNAELARLESDLRSRPLFGGRKVIVVRDGDGFVKRCGADAERLLDVPGGNALVLLARQLDGRTAFAKALQKRGVFVRCERPKAELSHFDLRRGGPSELEVALAEQARKRGIALSATAASELAARTGNDMLLAAGELEKLALYVGPGREVKPADVEELVPQSAALDQFRLFEEVATGDAAAALRRLRRIWTDGTSDRRGKRMTDVRGIAAVVIALLSRRLELLCRFRELKARGVAGPELQQALGVKNPGQMFFLEKEASLPLLARGTEALRVLALADRGLKSGVEPEIAVETAVARMAAWARPDARARGGVA